MWLFFILWLVWLGHLVWLVYRAGRRDRRLVK
jgi:hypothetical protein